MAERIEIKRKHGLMSLPGGRKYSNSRKLTAHRAAAFVIARRGQGFNDELAA